MANLSNRVAVFSLAYEPFLGGAEIALKEISRRLPDLRFTVLTHRFKPDWPDSENRGNLIIKRLGAGGNDLYRQGLQKILYVFRAWRAAEVLHEKEPFKAIWAVMAAYGGIAALFFKLRHPRVPMVLTLQEGDSEEHILKRVGIFYPFWRLIFKKADYIQAISGYLADFARRHGARCPIIVVPNGVNLERYNTNDANDNTNDSNNSRHSRLYSHHLCYIITTSRLVYKNGIDILIRAFANLQLTTYNLQLLILGDGPLRQELQDLAKGLGVANRVQFLGHVPPDEIPQFLGRADIFVRPSRSEGLGSSFLEAMAAGLPVIGTRVGGIPDFLKDKETGLFAEVENPRDLAEKINLLMTDNGLMERISKNGQELVFKKYSWNFIARRMGKIFSEIISHPELSEGSLKETDSSSSASQRIQNDEKTKKILIATGLFPPDIGGPATYSKLIAEEFPKRGFPVAVVAFSSVRRLPKLVRHWVYFWRLFKSARKNEVIFALDPVSVGLPAALAARLLGKKFVLKIVGDYAWEQGVQRFGVKELLDEFLTKKYGLRVEFLRTIECWVAKQADVIIVPSQYLKKVVVSWGIPADKITVVYNAFDMEDFSETKTEAKAKIGIRGHLIVSAGRLVPWKGFKALIDVFPEIFKSFPDAKLVIIGAGNQISNIKYQISNLRLENKVILAGALPKIELLRYLKAADVFVLNSGYEGLSHQILEALALGAPVVATRVGGNPELIESGVNGLLVGFNDAQELKNAIFKALSDKKLQEKFASAGPLSVGRFGKEKMIQETLLTLFPNP